MENCVFDKIIRGEIPTAKVWEDEEFLAFLSIAPNNPGHTLVIPKKHISYIFEMEDSQLGPLMVVCKKMAKAIEKAFNPKTGKVGVVVAGLDVPHTHVHLIPMNEAGDLDNDKAKHGVPFEELEKNAEMIKQYLV